jgi:hypothetical protein
LEELELPLPMLYPVRNSEGPAHKPRRLLTSPAITSSLRRLVLLPHGLVAISPRTFDNIIAELTGLTSLEITIDERISFDASEALAKLVNLRQLKVAIRVTCKQS